VQDSVSKGIVKSGFDHWENFGKANHRKYECRGSILEEPRTKLCKYGEAFYLSWYPDVRDSVKNGFFSSGFDHFQQFGMAEGRQYKCRGGCVDDCFDNGLTITKLIVASKPCKEGEDHYLRQHPDVKKAIKEGEFSSGFEHWKKHGQLEFRMYPCR